MYKLAKCHNDTQSDVNGSQVIQCFSAVLYDSSVFRYYFRYCFRYISDSFQIFQIYFR